MIVDGIRKNIDITNKPEHKVDIPVGKWMKCENCKEIIYKETVNENYKICPNCGKYFRLSSRRRIEQIIDEGTYKEFDLNITNVNPLNLSEYPKKLEALQKKTGLTEAIRCGTGKIENKEVVICVMDNNFFMGSMGSVVGEKITYSIEKAIEVKLPLIIFCVSGGARMQEGIISLMQMAKTTVALTKLNEAGNLYISILSASLIILVCNSSCSVNPFSICNLL